MEKYASLTEVFVHWVACSNRTSTRRGAMTPKPIAKLEFFTIILSVYISALRNDILKFI